jgi:hypothetical protein
VQIESKYFFYTELRSSIKSVLFYAGFNTVEKAPINHPKEVFSPKSEGNMEFLFLILFKYVLGL